MKLLKARRLLLIPDTHVPFHCRRSFSLMENVAKAWQPECLVILGDFADCADVSFHDKSPDRPYRLADELMVVNRVLDSVDGFGAKEKHYILGNHEYRLDRWIARNAPQMDGIVSIERELHLKKRGYTVTPYLHHTKIGKLHVTHDCGNAGPQAHIRALHTFGGNVAIGHTHRMAVHYEGNARGEQHVGAMFGWLGDVGKINYLHRVRSNAWTLGFGTGLQLANGNVLLTGHPIVNGSVRVDGKVFQ